MQTNIRWATIQPLTGGMSIGMEQSFGSPPVFIINNSAANNLEYINYMNNIRGLNIPVINMNWEASEFLTIEDEELFHFVNRDIDVVNFVPICSGLSMLNGCNSGCNARGDADNNQNQNMYNISRFVLNNINPLVAVMENAPNLYSNSGSNVLQYLKNIAKNTDRAMTVEKVDTYDYGIPQHRRRTFVYYWNVYRAPLIEPGHIDTPNLVDYFSLIPEDASCQDEYPIGIDGSKDFTYDCIQDLYNADGKFDSVIDVVNSVTEKPRNTSGLGVLHEVDIFEGAIRWIENKIAIGCTKYKYETLLRKVSHCRNKILMGKNFWDSSMCIAGHRNHVNSLIGKNVGALIHPTEDRSLNMRELTWLMGHPHDFELTRTKNYMMLTQNVTVGASKHVGDTIVKFINGELEISKFSFIAQNSGKGTIDKEEDMYVDED